MQIKNLFADEDAVSPVIGVILMVAITVILAAVIGAFVLGIGGSQTKVPQASFDYNVDSGGHLEVTHQGGDAITPDRISFAGARTEAAGDVSIVSDANSNSKWDAGETMTGTSTSWSTGEEAQVVWSSPSSDSTNIIGSGTI
ncbi:type IV pilin N-terminal domain-containing protein [Halorubellus sp. PRR65]|uniref:type IV pilin N-terminal domain-containing protein n=1 Tax=Halorubellus sp. PRR65 TaxID=3098148 RepID=UPI002B25A3A9|nr:type IV pilin N-terminal domain-containing protein [Halorubellus sp. PRR65]